MDIHEFIAQEQFVLEAFKNFWVKESAERPSRCPPRLSANEFEKELKRFVQCTRLLDVFELPKAPKFCSK